MRGPAEPLPILLVVLDGLADRPYPELGGMTPLEAAHTPVMDRLAADGQSGFHYPLGPGRVPSTELVHWRFLGYEAHPFCGRACLEALGEGVPCEPGDVFAFLALRRVARRKDGAYRVVGGYGEEFADAAGGYERLDGWTDAPTGYRFEVFPLGRGEAVLRLPRGGLSVSPSGDVTDSDPFFFTDLPVLRPQPTASAADPAAAAATARALARFLGRAAEVFDHGSGPERLVVHKWTGTFRPVPAFRELTGADGAVVASSRLMRGLARAFGLAFVEHPEGKAAEGLADKLESALDLLFPEEGEYGAAFAHVHTKAADEAAHAGDPREKAAVIEDLDRGLRALLEIAPEELVLCVTADHATPVGGRTVHWGDSVPVLLGGPHVRVDEVGFFDERSAVGGGLGQIEASDLLPYLLCQAERAHFMGARPLPVPPLGVPHRAEPWRHEPSPERAPRP